MWGRLPRLLVVLALGAGLAYVLRRLLGRRPDHLPDPSEIAGRADRTPWPPPPDPKQNGDRPVRSSPAPAPTAETAGAGTATATATGTASEAEAEPKAGWVEPDGEGACPTHHPIKAKMSSKIFHEPGQLNYERTIADRCYATTEAAEADGLRAAKR